MAKAIVIFHRLAQKEYLKAFDHYAAISADLALAFKEEIDKAVEKIARQPDAWPSWGKSYRWVRTRRFPFLLYFQVGDVVEVMAVSHSRRRLGYWAKRKYY